MSVAALITVQQKKLALKPDVVVSVALEDMAVKCCDSSLSSQSQRSTETKKETKNFNDFASSLITVRIYSAERQSVLKLLKRSLKGQTRSIYTVY